MATKKTAQLTYHQIEVVLGHAIKMGTKSSRLMLTVATAGLTTILGCGTTSIEASRSAIPRTVPAVASGAELSTALSAFESGSFGYAVKYFEMASKKNPNDMVSCLGMAASYDWLYRFELADDAYDRCGEIDDGSFSYHNNKGFSYLLRGDYGNASVSFARAAQLQPDSPVIQNNLKVLQDATSG